MQALSFFEQQKLSTLSVVHMLRAPVAGGKIALPVSPYTVFAQFRHIQGVQPGPSGAGYSINKARIIDSLIHRLVSLKESGSDGISADLPRSTAGMSDEALDALIEQYSQKLHTALTSGLPKLEAQFGTSFAAAGGAAPPSVLAGTTGMGTLLNLTA